MTQRQGNTDGDYRKASRVHLCPNRRARGAGVGQAGGALQREGPPSSTIASAGTTPCGTCTTPRTPTVPHGHTPATHPLWRQRWWWSVHDQICVNHAKWSHLASHCWRRLVCAVDLGLGGGGGGFH